MYNGSYLCSGLEEGIYREATRGYFSLKTLTLYRSRLWRWMPPGCRPPLPGERDPVAPVRPTNVTQDTRLSSLITLFRLRFRGYHNNKTHYKNARCPIDKPMVATVLTLVNNSGSSYSPTIKLSSFTFHWSTYRIYIYLKQVLADSTTTSVLKTTQRFGRLKNFYRYQVT